MARLDRSDSTVTQFPGEIRFEEQQDLILPTTMSPKRTGLDDLQTSKLSKKIRHEKQSVPTGDDTDQPIFDTRPPRFPPKLNGSESLFVPQEIHSPAEPLLGFLPLRRASPWEYYTKSFRRELGGSVVVACKNPVTFELFAVKCIAGSEVDNTIQTLRQVRHENFLTCCDIFEFDDAMYTVSECMAISLMDLNGCAIPPNEIQIATIIHQVR